MCYELDRWTKMQKKMQLDGKQKDKKETYHSTLFLEQLFKYMFRGEFYITKKMQKPKKNQKGPKRNYNMFWIVGEEH